jgi:hypothetical protein
MKQKHHRHMNRKGDGPAPRKAMSLAEWKEAQRAQQKGTEDNGKIGQASRHSDEVRVGRILNQRP